MSSSSANDLRSALNRAGALVRPNQRMLSPVRVLAFWAAVALPFLYLPLLLTGLTNTATTAAFLALLCVNAVALLVGHHHRRE